MVVKMPERKENERGKRPASRHANVPPRNPNKRTTTITADRSLARLKEENRAVIYGYRN